MSLQIGLAKTDITPPTGIFLAGFANRLAPSEGVYLPLTATAVAIADGENAALLVGAEILGFYEHTERVRRRIGERTGLKPYQILLNGSHTHCGPVLREVDRIRHGSIDDDYITELVEKIAECAHRAWEQREPSALKFATSQCDLAVNRRLVDEHGNFQMRPNPKGLVDHTVSVLTVETLQGKLKGVVFSYACHPTSRGELLIGGDYVGFALRSIERSHPGLTACFIQGCAGDIKPGPIDPEETRFTPRTVEQVQEIGDKLGEVVGSVMESKSRHPIEGNLQITHQIVTLEMESVTDAQIASGLKDSNPVIRSWAEHFQNLKIGGRPFEIQVPFEVQTLAIGRDFALVGLSGEISVEYALRLKGDLAPHFSHQVITGYANQIIGYVPSRRQIPEGGYEVWGNQYHLKRPGPYLEKTEDLICQTVLNLLKVR